MRTRSEPNPQIRASPSAAEIDKRRTPGAAVISDQRPISRKIAQLARTANAAAAAPALPPRLAPQGFAGPELAHGTDEGQLLPHDAGQTAQRGQDRLNPTKRMVDQNGNDDVLVPREVPHEGGHSLEPAPIASAVPDSPKAVAANQQAIVQRQILPEWMPAAHLDAMIASSNGNRAEALEAYLAIPVGPKYEYFTDLARTADRYARRLGKTANFRVRLAALRAAPPVTLTADIQLLATAMNAVIVEGEAWEGRGQDALRRVTAALAIKPERLADPKKTEALLRQWQLQLGRARADLLEAPHDTTRIAVVEKFLGLIGGLALNDAEVVEYDSSWKAAPMKSDIEVDSGGAVVGATINIKRGDATNVEKFRRRLTVSKARHMWDYADSITNEPANSLLPRGTDLATVEQDILELARDLKDRYLAGKEAAAYEFKTASGRGYRVNKTTSEYPHTFPVGGGDIVPLTRTQYNFLVQSKPYLAGLVGKTAEAKRSILKLRDQERLTPAEVGQMRAIMRQLNLESAEAGFAAALEQEATDSGISPSDRASAKGKKTKPRKAAGPKLGWNQ